MDSLLLTGFSDFCYNLGNRWLHDGQEFLRAVLPKLLVIGLGAWILIRLLGLLTRHMMTLAEKHDNGSGRIPQVKTLASVVRATGIGIIAFLAALEILPLLGVDLKPLLASAGVAGVALGLAAQTIVKDVLNGILLVIEDQFSVGDVVTIAGVTGTVEELTLRRTTIRGFDGTLYVVPNSQITNTANMSRDYSVTTLMISVEFSAPPDEVVAMLKSIAMSVRNDPEYSSIFLADPEVPGVDSIKGSEVMYPVVLRTRARKQFAAVREIQRRIRLALEEKEMLPGSPYRVPATVRNAGSSAVAAVAAEEAPPGPKADPTTNPPQETNPFVAQS
jgi:moderate conductance mechanosensitive channel